MDFVSGIALATSDLRNRLKETPAASAILLTGIIPLSKPLPVCSEKAMTEKVSVRSYENWIRVGQFAPLCGLQLSIAPYGYSDSRLRLAVKRLAPLVQRSGRERRVHRISEGHSARICTLTRNMRFALHKSDSGDRVERANMGCGALPERCQLVALNC